MKIYSVDIRSFTCSFRHPMLISGTQLTLEVPPLSTILGLINAAAGRYLIYSGEFIGYYFEYESKATDVETVYMAEVNKKGALLATTRSNIIHREFLFEPFLRLYSSSNELIHFFREPIYQLLLGRSSDLATADISSILERKLEPLKQAEKISGQIIPYRKAALPGRIQPLAKYFSDTIPRQMLGKEPYVVINCRSSVPGPLPVWRDNINGKEVDIFFHDVDSITF